MDALAGAGVDEELAMTTVLAKLTAQPGKEAEMQAALERMVAEVDAKEPGVAMYSMHTVEGSRGRSGCGSSMRTRRRSRRTVGRTI